SRKSPTYELSSPALTTMLQMRSAIHPALRILHRSRGAVSVSDGVDAHQFLAVANRHRERNRGPRLPLACGEDPGDLTVIVKHRAAAVSAARRVDGQLVVIAKGADHRIGRFHLTAVDRSYVANADGRVRNCSQRIGLIESILRKD